MLNTENRLLALFVASFAVHALVLLAMPRAVAPVVARTPIEMTMFVPPTAAKVEPRQARPVVKRVRAAGKTETPAAKVEASVSVGPSEDSVSSVGTFALPTGSSTFGPVKPGIATASSSKPGEGSAPPGTADAEPVLLGEIKVPYPAEAQRNDVSGTVRMQVTIDALGVVTAVKVLGGPGYGLDEAARDAMLRFRFRPAVKSGEAVGYTFTYAYTFELE